MTLGSHFKKETVMVKLAKSDRERLKARSEELVELSFKQYHEVAESLKKLRFMTVEGLYIEAELEKHSGFINDETGEVYSALHDRCKAIQSLTALDEIFGWASGVNYL